MQRWMPVAAVAAAAVVGLGGAAYGYAQSRNAPVAIPAAKLAGSECAGLINSLPKTVDGKNSRDTTPRSDFTAAWGNPAVTLSCGVPRPDALDPTSPNFNLNNDDTPWIDGVAWIGVNGNGGVLYTTTERDVFIQVWCPSKGEMGPEGAGMDTADPLGDLAPAIIQRTLRSATPSTGADPQATPVS
jgi:Protein of unknown function (DUF3515)